MILFLLLAVILLVLGFIFLIVSVIAAAMGKTLICVLTFGKVCDAPQKENFEAPAEEAGACAKDKCSTKIE